MSSRVRLHVGTVKLKLERRETCAFHALFGFGERLSHSSLTAVSEVITDLSGVDAVLHEDVGQVPEEHDHDRHGAASDQRRDDPQEDQETVPRAGEAKLK